MDTESVSSAITPPPRASETPSSPPDNIVNIDKSKDSSSTQSTSGLSSWARTFKLPLPLAASQDDSSTVNPPQSTFARLASGLTSRLSPREQTPEQGADTASSQSNFIGNITKGLVDTSRSAVRAVQVKARRVVSQNKRRYQEDGYDLDLTYIMENIIAMGFPAGDMSSGLFGYIEGFYRNHMEEVISFLESHHKGKYKVYNLCSERLYDASLLEGKVASFPFDDHNCPPIQLIISFCQSAYAWLKDDIQNVVAVHCKAGMARTGLMISCLLLYLKFFPTAEECIDYYNQKRCYDGKALVLPSQIRYVKYFERILTYFNGENQPGRRCMLRGFRLHKCPYWIRPQITISDHNGVLFSTKNHPRTKDVMPEEFWFTAPKKGIMVFALPGEPGLTELAGDFKVQFHDRQGDFYFWLNTTMIENRKILDIDDMDGFDKRKFPSPGFQLEIVLVDHNGMPSTAPQPETVIQVSDENSGISPTPANEASSTPNPTQDSRIKPQSQQDKDNVFSDDDGVSRTSIERKSQTTATTDATKSTPPDLKSNASSVRKVEGLTNEVEKVSLGKGSSTQLDHSVDNSKNDSSIAKSGEVSEFKAMAADASVFTFGDDEEDYESD